MDCWHHFIFFNFIPYLSVLFTKYTICTTNSKVVDVFVNFLSNHTKKKGKATGKIHFTFAITHPSKRAFQYTNYCGIFCMWFSCWACDICAHGSLQCIPHFTAARQSCTTESGQQLLWATARPWSTTCAPTWESNGPLGQLDHTCRVLSLPF